MDTGWINEGVHSIFAAAVSFKCFLHFPLPSAMSSSCSECVTLLLTIGCRGQHIPLLLLDSSNPNCFGHVTLR